jgi:hypothetical protein
MEETTNTHENTLLILSDLHGFSKGDIDWIKTYTQALSKYHRVVLIDSKSLAGIATEETNEEQIHQQFVQTGIQKAVEKLIGLYPKPVYALGLSVGGTILWKAALNGLEFIAWICLSSTRLRKENEKPGVLPLLFYGSDDPYQPEQSWFKRMGLVPVILEGKAHTFYKETDEFPHLLTSLSRHLNPHSHE